jgi:uncharacterized protein (DUF1697 family)
MKYVALLRGINSGKNPMIKMELLKNTFESLGFKNVKTIIASGNVIFETDKVSEKLLEEKIEQALPKHIGFQSSTIVRTIEDIEKLFNKNPFKNVETGPDRRPHVTFLKHDPDTTKISHPKGSHVVGIFDRVICYVIDISGKTPNIMADLEKQFGKTITTRNWKTVERILKAASN